jgi:hypothetical protein
MQQHIKLKKDTKFISQVPSIRPGLSNVITDKLLKYSKLSPHLS